MKIGFLLLVLLCTIVYCEDKWLNYKKQFSKHFNDPNEENLRQQIFLEKRDKIKAHNALYKQGKVTYKLGLNRFSDMKRAEFSSRMRGVPPLTLQIQKEFYENSEPPILAPLRGPLPAQVDWNSEGAVNSVIEQGDVCGSCYGWATVGAIEASIYIKTKTLHRLSTQQIIDCSAKFGNLGCSGGWPANAFQYLKKTGGIALENDYPYTASVNECQAKKNQIDKIKLKGYVALPFADEAKLLQTVATIGPVAIAIHSNISSFQDYTEGVYSSTECDPMAVDHAVLLVGYGTTAEGEDYWLIKNSWSWTWGMNGYAMIARNKNNHCGVASIASYPIIKDPKIIKAKPKTPKKI